VASAKRLAGQRETSDGRGPAAGWIRDERKAKMRLNIHLILGGFCRPNKSATYSLSDGSWEEEERTK